MIGCASPLFPSKQRGGGFICPETDGLTVQPSLQIMEAPFPLVTKHFLLLSKLLSSHGSFL